MNRAAQRVLLWSKIVLPLIGAIGKVSKKAPMMHIAKPTLPITLKPPIRRKQKKPAKTNETKISAEDRIAPRRFVNFGP